ncbi:MAG: acylneuraminate cytidylyltransferase family protein [Desulfobacula sp.]|uniref:acylneuraminate cytidylyltransferase family protein n=1 Tax=Desulfobacula sp. TaxID=2593537 RepID=UPI0025BF2616|nr:acylneuraminate cytidylyltransferase family protein [Desulfobacula sp.]MCD4722139.1 acylneuraminate cytidylyltransferase family protein [Desulfobacula sp.]
MYNDQRILGLITARGGSKGLPGKNIINIAGKPLIAWTIECAQKSGYLDRLIVSTDNNEIARVCREYNAQVPFLRPAHLASDTATSIDVVMHAIDTLKEKGEEYDYICLLEPTSPLREPHDIDDSIKQLINMPDAEAIVGVCPLESMHPEFNVTMDVHNFISKYETGQNIKSLRRQDLASVYFFEGTIYISKISAVREKMGFYHDKTLGYIVPRHKSIEIDDQYDILMAEAILKERLNKANHE